jgi:hypothetical protein
MSIPNSNDDDFAPQDCVDVSSQLSGYKIPAQSSSVRSGPHINPPPCTNPSDPTLASNIAIHDEARQFINATSYLYHHAHNWKNDPAYPACKAGLIASRLKLENMDDNVSSYLKKRIDFFLLWQSKH